MSKDASAIIVIVLASGPIGSQFVASSANLSDKTMVNYYFNNRESNSLYIARFCWSWKWQGKTGTSISFYYRIVMEIKRKKKKCCKTMKSVHFLAQKLVFSFPFLSLFLFLTASWTKLRFNVPNNMFMKEGEGEGQNTYNSAGVVSVKASLAVLYFSWIKDAACLLIWFMNKVPIIHSNTTPSENTNFRP